MHHFGVDPIDLSLLSPQCVEDWIIGLTQRYRPGSLGVIRASLQSYFRYRALRGRLHRVALGRTAGIGPL